MRFYFKHAEVKRLVEHAKNAVKHKALYDQPHTETPGLWIVGDEGVYLMSNGLPALDDNDGDHVAYAKGMNPQTDDWIQRKRESFGGDDGADFLPLKNIEDSLATAQPNKQGWFALLDITPQSIGILSLA